MAEKVKAWWWLCYPTPSEGWGRGGTPRRLNSRSTPQGLDQMPKVEEAVPKMARRRVKASFYDNPDRMI